MMLVHKTLLFLGLLAAGANAAPTANAHHLEARKQPSTLWRVDTRSPKEIEKAGGFHAKQPGKLHEYGLWNHVRMETTEDVESGYVSTTSTKTFAERWAGTQLQNGGGYIYEIAPSGVFVDVGTILGEFLDEAIGEDQSEFAAEKSIQFAQIKGWQKYTPTGFDANDDPTGTLDTYVHNPSFDGTKYPKNIAPINYALAGFPADHKAWKKQPWLAVAECKDKSTVHKRETSKKSAASGKHNSGKKNSGKKAGSKVPVSGKKLATGKGKPKGKPAATTCKKPVTAKEAYDEILEKAGVKGSSNGAPPKKTIGSKTTGKKASTGTKSKTHPR
jgi:cholera enterotoxin subunit A